jgi:DNA repair protein RadC
MDDTIHEAVRIQSLPSHLRPREKLRLRGPEALSEQELLAALLGSATRARPVLAVADELLRRCGQLSGLRDVGLSQLAALPGLGQAGACRIAAVVEIARRMARTAARSGATLATAAAVDALVRADLATERRERVHVLVVDARSRLLGERCVSVGSLMSSVIHPREVFRPAIELAAAAVILVHNHPSGDPTPSVEDHQVTARLAEAGTVLGIRLLDHVVVAAEGYRSFKEEGWLS